jgi:hypothetical protein
MTDIEKAIRTEICKALENLGGPPKMLAAVGRRAQGGDVRRGGDRQLLATIRSWGDTLTDEQVLEDLRRLNSGRPIFDVAIASTGGHG